MDFTLILISSPESFPDEAEYILRLFQNGLKKFHLRKPGMKKAGMRELIRSIPAKYHPRIVIHSHYNLARKFSLGGIHLPEKIRMAGRTKRIKGKTFSASFHSFKDMSASGEKYDYVFIGPVFDSISKKGYRSRFEAGKLKKSTAHFKRTVPKKSTKIIAIGGVSDKNILKVKAAGFDGAAVLGSVWQEGNPLKSFLKIRSKLR